MIVISVNTCHVYLKEEPQSCVVNCWRISLMLHKVPAIIPAYVLFVIHLRDEVQ